MYKEYLQKFDNSNLISETSQNQAKKTDNKINFLDYDFETKFELGKEIIQKENQLLFGRKEVLNSEIYLKQNMISYYESKRENTESSIIELKNDIEQVF